ncbi:MAG: hypothetical protein ACR2O2_14055 [Ruegeria sp.]
MTDGNLDAAASEQTVPNIKKLSLFSLLKAMTLFEWAAVVAVLISVGGGAATVGAWLEGQKRADIVAAAVAPVQTELDKVKTAQIDVLSQNASLLRANQAMENQVRIFSRQAELDAAFTTFSQNYINWLAGGGDVAKDILVDYVCLLFRESQVAGQKLQFDALSFKDVVAGDFDASLEELQKSGFNSALIKELRQLREAGGQVTERYRQLSTLTGERLRPRVTRNPNTATVYPEVDVEEIEDLAVSTVEEAEGRMIKTVTFPQRPPFVLPQDVALAVHKNPGCRVR